MDKRLVPVWLEVAAVSWRWVWAWLGLVTTTKGEWVLKRGWMLQFVSDHNCITLDSTSSSLKGALSETLSVRTSNNGLEVKK